MELKIGEKIRRRRKQMRLTLKELAGEMVTPAQISAVEKGKCRPSHGLLEYIAKRLETDVEYFTLSDEERYRKDFENIKSQSQKLYDEKKYEEVSKVLSGMDETLAFLRDDQKGFYYAIKGNCCYDNSDYDSAFDLYVKALTYYLKTKDVDTIANIYIKVANCLYRTKKYDMALGYYLGANKYLNEKIAHDTAARILYDTALCYMSLKRYDQAKECLESCREYIDTHEWPKKGNLVPGINMMKGIIERDLKLNRVSIEEFNKAFEQYKQDNNIVGMGRAKNNTALCLWDLGEKEKAIKCFREAIEYKDQCNDETLIDTYMNMAELYKEMEDLEGSLEVINTAEEKMLSRDSVNGLIEIFTRKFEYLAEMKDYDRAEIFAFLALDYIEKKGDKKAESNLYIKLSEMHKNMGDEKSVIEYLIKANKF